MVDTGLDSLVGPVSEEDKAVECLTSHLSQMTQHVFYEGNAFLDNTSKFLWNIKTFTTLSPSVTAWSPCLRSLLQTISETVFVLSSSLVCKKASEDVIVVPSKIKAHLYELLLRLSEIEKLVFYLQEEMCHISRTRHVREVPHEESLNIIRGSQNALDMLERCQALLVLVVDGIERKVTFEIRFFNTASVTAGVISAGRLAWSLWQGDTVEQLVSAGLWSTCVGLSVVVLQIPRVRVTDVQTELSRQRQYRQQMKKITGRWENLSEWSYSKFVRTPSLGNGRVSL